MNSAAAQPDLLAGLRGYHLPQPVSWWPPAPGWWVLGALVLLGAVALSLGLWRRHRRRAALRAALGELDALSQTNAEQDPGAFVRSLSTLLRRYALTRYPRREVAGLSGEAWLRFLADHGGGTAFTEGTGRLLSEAPYRRPDDAAPLRELATLTRAWLLRNAEVRR